MASWNINSFFPLNTESAAKELVKEDESLHMQMASSTSNSLHEFTVSPFTQAQTNSSSSYPKHCEDVLLQ